MLSECLEQFGVKGILRGKDSDLEGHKKWLQRSWRVFHANRKKINDVIHKFSLVLRKMIEKYGSKFVHLHKL